MRALMNIVGFEYEKLDEKKQDQIETVVVTALMALLGALGVIFSFAVFTGSDIFTWNPMIALSVYFIFSGIIWGVLIIKNH